MDSMAGVMSFGTETGCLNLTRSGSPPCLERVMGIEPTSSAWKAEVLPLNYTRGPSAGIRPLASNRIRPDSHTLVEGVGFEPTKAEPPDLQSGPFGRSGTPPQRKRGIVLEGANRVKRLTRISHRARARIRTASAALWRAVPDPPLRAHCVRPNPFPAGSRTRPRCSTYRQVRPRPPFTRERALIRVRLAAAARHLRATRGQGRAQASLRDPKSSPGRGRIARFRGPGANPGGEETVGRDWPPYFPAPASSRSTIAPAAAATSGSIPSSLRTGARTGCHGRGRD